MKAQLALSAVTAVLLMATAPLGGPTFAAAVAAAGLLVLIAAAPFTARLGVRPLLPAAAIGGIGVPVWRLFDATAGWHQLSAVLSAAVLGAFLLGLVSTRSTAITGVIATTLALALLVGMGTASLVTLRAGPAGFRWTIAVLALGVLAPVAAAVAERVGAARLAAAAAVVAGGAVAGVLVAVARPPFEAPVAVGTAVAAGASVWAAQLLVRDAAASNSGEEAPGVPYAATGQDWLHPVPFGVGLLLTATLVALLASLLQA